MARPTNLRRERRLGAVLLEAVVALAILATAGVGLVAFAAAAMQAVAHRRDAETEMRHASAFLDAVALWTRDDLDRHLGTRPEGRWRLFINRPTGTLYLVTLRDSTTGGELLHTALFRPEVASEVSRDAQR